MANWSSPRPSSGAAAARAALLMGLLLIGFFSALLLGSGQYVLAGLLSVPVLALIGLMVFVVALGWRNDAIFWAIVLSLFAASLASSLLRQRFAFIPTALLLMATPFVAAAVLRLRGRSQHASALIWIVVAFYALGIVSSLAGRSGLLASVYTGLLSLKPFLLLGLGAALVWSDKTERNFERIVHWAWVPFLALAALQWFAPSVYGAILSDPEAVYDRNPFAAQFPRALGPFNHPSVLAVMAGTFAVFNFAYAVLDRQRTAFRLVVCACYLVVLVMSGQRQELAATLIVLPVVLALVRVKPGLPLLLLVAGVCLVLVGGLLYTVIPDNVERELENWGLLQGRGDLSARSVLYADATRLAREYWPLGTGFGTFASVGSIRFDQSLFVELGYGSFWWYGQRSYLYDSFWSRYIAETGWFGFGLQILFYALALHAVLRWLRGPEAQDDPLIFRRVVLAASGLILVLLISPTSNALSEPHGAMFPLVYIGVVWRQIVSQRLARHSNPQRSKRGTGPADLRVAAVGST